MSDYEASREYQAMLQDMADEGSDIGGVYIQFYTYKDVRAGLHEVHRTADGMWCSGGVTFDIPETQDLPGAKWTLNSMEPLDLSPSLLCRRCGHHGFIRQGRWVSA